MPDSSAVRLMPCSRFANVEWAAAGAAGAELPELGAAAIAAPPVATVENCESKFAKLECADAISSHR